MKTACFWSAVSLVAIALCLESVKGSMKKVNEVGSRPIHGHYCGDNIKDVYYSLCYYSGKRKRSSALMDEKEASSFLHPQTIRSKRAGTNIVEECCKEGCHHEEIYEYC